MSMFPKKYHGSGVKCGGPQMCSDCRERQKKGISLDNPPTTIPSTLGHNRYIDVLLDTKNGDINKTSKQIKKEAKIMTDSILNKAKK